MTKQEYSDELAGKWLNDTVAPVEKKEKKEKKAPKETTGRRKRWSRRKRMPRSNWKMISWSVCLDSQIGCSRYQNASNNGS